MSLPQPTAHKSAGPFRQHPGRTGVDASNTVSAIGFEASAVSTTNVIAGAFTTATTASTSSPSPKKRVRFAATPTTRVCYIVYTTHGSFLDDTATPPPAADESQRILEPGGRAARACALLERAGQVDETRDLCMRDFARPISRGGCGSDWQLLENKLHQIDYPCWTLIGNLWNVLHGDAPRFDEELSC